MATIQYIHTKMHAFIHTYTHKHTNTYTPTHTHTYIHIETQKLLCCVPHSLSTTQFTTTTNKATFGVYCTQEQMLCCCWSCWCSWAKESSSKSDKWRRRLSVGWLTSEPKINKLMPGKKTARTNMPPPCHWRLLSMVIRLHGNSSPWQRPSFA